MRLMIALLSASAAGGLMAAALGMLPRRPRRRRRRGRSEWLVQAGVCTTPFQFWVASVGAGALTLVTVTLLTGSWAVAAVPTVLVGMLPRLYFGAQRRRRLGEVRQAWPTGCATWSPPCRPAAPSRGLFREVGLDSFAERWEKGLAANLELGRMLKIGEPGAIAK